MTRRMLRIPAVTLLLAGDLFAMEELVAFSADEVFLCLALWNDAICLGTAGGAVAQAEGRPGRVRRPRARVLP